MKKGLVQLFVGDGKGKTSLAVGSSIRAVGSGFKVLFFQFLKNGDSGEVSVLKSIPGIDFLDNPISNTFVFSGDAEKANAYKDMYSPIIDEIVQKTTDGSYDMVVLDEAVDAYNLGIFQNLIYRYHALGHKVNTLYLGYRRHICALEFKACLDCLMQELCRNR